MGRNSNFSEEFKLKYVQICLEGKDSINHTAYLAGIDPATLRQWIRNYQSLGIDGLCTTSKNSYLSKELKEMAVDVCVKYGIRSKRMFQKWVIKYNSHEELKASGTGGVPIMTNGRKTTFDERVEIVKYCIENQNNYASISSLLGVAVVPSIVTNLGIILAEKLILLFTY